MMVFAHYDRDAGEGEPLHEHLKLVADRAAEFASSFSASVEAQIAGLLHDLGKSGEAFQRRLKGEISRVDHWSAGAWQALQLYQASGVAIALAIQGHHLGLQSASKDALQKLSPDYLQQHPLKLTLSYATPDRLRAAGIELPAKSELTSLYQWGVNNASSMLDVRMLFSALVDADFLETEAWFNRDEQGSRRYRPPALELEPEQALAALEDYVHELASRSTASPQIQALRSELFFECVAAGQYTPGIFTLTAPTGSGKTLAMLGFALAHAKHHGLKRIIVVLPYLTLIEQTARVYRQVFRKFVSEGDMPRYICEDHSLASSKADTTGTLSDFNPEDLLSENWDAPVIITTNVQFLESLFSNRPSACRKLHRLARSVILFDEVQTMPLCLVVPSLGALSHLVTKYGTTVVFATATQPAFSHLHDAVRKQASSGWQPREIVSNASALFYMAKRSRIILQKDGEAAAWDEIADSLASEAQVLCVVNTKKQAKRLFQAVKAKRGNVFHLSTNMCPLHRSRTLEQVRSLLEHGRPCCLISTQCVEAGVDIDFPAVFRCLGPLDAIAQAAGRCNRNALWDSGKVYIFRPQDEAYPDDAYRQATDIAISLLNRKRVTNLDTADLGLFTEYYRDLYSLRGISQSESNKDPLLEAIRREDFVEVSRRYRVIPRYTISVVVPYEKEEYSKLVEHVRQNGLSYQWIISARPHTVSLYRPRSVSDQLYSLLEPVRISPDCSEESEEWFIYRKEEDYDLETGLNIETYSEAIIA